MKNKLLISIIIILVIILVSYIYLLPRPRLYYLLSVYQRPVSIESKRDFAWNKKTYPFRAAAEFETGGKIFLFLGGEKRDALLTYLDGKLIDVIKGTNLSNNMATYAAVVIDLDGDGAADFVISRSDGIYIYKNNKNGKKISTRAGLNEIIKALPTFTIKKIMDTNADWAGLGLSISDFNRDGIADIYISRFIHPSKFKGNVFNKGGGRSNLLLMGQDATHYKDVTVDVGLGKDINNTFTAAFVDLNNDEWPDLVISNDTGNVEVYKNKNGKEFEYIAKVNSGLGNWMGLAIGDYDNDGDNDLFLTNVGVDSKKWEKNNVPGRNFSHILLRNDGDFRFTNITESSGISGRGFGWGAIFEDLNADGRLDLLFAQNWMKSPIDKVMKYPGFFYQNTGKKFKRVFKYINKSFGQTPIFSDINGDGRKDILWLNINSPPTAYINKEIDNNYINVKLPNSIEFANASVYVISGNLMQQRQNIMGGTGLGVQQSPTLFFGLGARKKIDSVMVKTITNPPSKYYFINPKINSTLIVIKK